LLLDKCRGNLETPPAPTLGIETAKLMQGLVYGTVEAVIRWKSKQHKWRTHEAKSREASCGGGLTRSREETSVMGLNEGVSYYDLQFANLYRMSLHSTSYHI